MNPSVGDIVWYYQKLPDGVSAPSAAIIIAVRGNDFVDLVAFPAHSHGASWYAPAVPKATGDTPPTVGHWIPRTLDAPR